MLVRSSSKKDQPQPKRARPETLAQARHWDEKVSRYRRAGFCDRCAAQAAWGHQIGFSNTQPVGDCCAGRPLPERAGDRAARWVGNKPLAG
jgi:hypothetical protein